MEVSCAVGEQLRLRRVSAVLCASSMEERSKCVAKGDCVSYVRTGLVWYDNIPCSDPGSGDNQRTII